MVFFSLCDWTRTIAENDRKAHYNSIEEQCIIKEAWEYYLPDKQKLGKTVIEEESEGEKRLRALIENLETLDGKGFKRARHQVKFHKAFIGRRVNVSALLLEFKFTFVFLSGAALKKILKEDINNNLTRIIEKYNLNKDLTNDVIITTPRRFGKTYSVALFVAAYLLSQPNCEVSIYSTGRRASQKLLVLIKKLVIILAGSEDIILEFSHKETLIVRGPGGQPSTCNSYPSKVEISINTRAVNLLALSIACLTITGVIVVVCVCVVRYRNGALLPNGVIYSSNISTSHCFLIL